MDLRSFLVLEKENLTQERDRLSRHCSEYSKKEDSLKDTLAEHAHIKLYDNETRGNKDAKFNTSNVTNKDKSGLSSLTGQCMANGAKHDLDKGDLIHPTPCDIDKREREIPVIKTIIEKHDMDQWISDTFYSHFPGFNNEYQNRQLYLQKRQKENEENLIKHQMLHAAATATKRKTKYKIPEKEADNSTIESGGSSTTSNTTILNHDNTKPLDVNNTNIDSYILLKDDSLSSARSGSSSRYKHMQDLRHTNLANMLNRDNEDETVLNRKRAEIETARKKQYQQELMQQIEEKRRTIKMLKDKEVQQERVLTKRLEEQLKTMKLEEKLEKERLKATKIRYDAEQNHLMREHLLSKLENDTKLLKDKAGTKTITNDEINKENITRHNNENRVYRYFSNSEKHEYNLRKKSGLPSDIGLTGSAVDLPKIERECFHLSEKICPGCDEPLREFDDYCLRCQTKNLKSLKTPESTTSDRLNYGLNGSADDEFGWIAASERGRSFHLACIKCERFYKLCSACIEKSDVCKACQNKRNICMNCRRSLCTFCLEEIACGKDTEKLHVNETERSVNSKTDLPNDGYVQVLSVNGEADNSADNKSAPRAPLKLSEQKYLPVNNLNIYEPQPSLSPNNGRVSIHADRNNMNMNTLPDYNMQYLTNDNDEDFEEYEEMNIERLRRETDKRIFRYLKNYKELAFLSRGTQTTPNSTARRDIVISGEQSLSIPLLREMPRMTRTITKHTNNRKSNSDDIENLKRRWEIPAVQKESVSLTSPRVITQIGAVRRQLQTETLFSDDSI